MSENAGKPREQHRLSDEALGEVTGGDGYWTPWRETVRKRDFVGRSWSREIKLGYEDWLRTVESADDLAARDAWIAAGSPSDAAYYLKNGVLSTEPYVD